ncbi:MAG TPA: recombinase family protein [Dehalococcoidia bacterium]
MRAVGYFREDPAERGPGDALAEQNRAFLEFCKREGYQVAATFMDTAASGTDRPGFRQMIEYLKRPDRGFTVVVVQAAERLGPGPLAAARALFQLDRLGAKVVFLAGEQDPLPTLLSLWRDRGQAERLGDRVRAAMRKKAVKGEALGRPPYGYRVGARRRLEVVPEEAAVVRQIFKLYLQEGLGIRLIARRLNEEGHRTRRGGNWSMVTIRDILRNRAYLGTYTRFGVRVPGSHPALITPEEFRQAQEKLEERRTAPGRRQAAPFLLSGLVHCGHCGNRMIGVSRRQRWTRRQDGGESTAEYRYYQCESRTNQSMCDYHTRRAADLEAAVRDSLDRAALESVPKAGDDAAVLAGLRLDASRVRARLKQTDRRLETLLTAAAGGRLRPDRLRALSLQLAGEQLELEEQITEIEKRIHQQATAAERQEERNRRLAELRDRWDELTFEQRRALLRQVVDRVVVTDDGIKTYLKP